MCNLQLKKRANCNNFAKLFPVLKEQQNLMVDFNIKNNQHVIIASLESFVVPSNTPA